MLTFLGRSSVQNLNRLTRPKTEPGISHTESNMLATELQHSICNTYYFENFFVPIVCKWPGYRSRYSDWLRSGRSGDRIPVGTKFFAPVQTGPGAHPPSCTMGTASFPGFKSGRGMTLTLTLS